MESANKIDPNKKMELSGGPFMYDGIIWIPFPGLYPEPEKKFKQIRDMECRDSDVFLCSFPKAGTHWTHEILSMLLSGSTQYNQYNTIENMIEAASTLDKINSAPSRRLLVTHLPYKYLPEQLRNGTGKIVYVQRNPKDLHVSMYNHLKGKGIMKEGTTWNEFIEQIFTGQLKMFGGWFQFSKDWEKEIDIKKNILPLYYEEMKQDITGNILKTAEYLNVPCKNEFAMEVGDKCSFDKLKNNKLDYTALVDKNRKSTLFRKGQVGDWKNWFTVAQNECFGALYDDEMKSSNLKFTYEQ
ncbi:sulfotransferase 1C2-like isoform X1 [Mytilus galloprovincialis]|uniref:sulfotransferase 1C2-like isoform X1 n=2 Tax=Mytilus galloprovincialis TaxID=29158 RepID=UPI003F7BD2B1|nr:sulfotransferases 1B1 [Mytilus galloprovincialis]